MDNPFAAGTVRSPLRGDGAECVGGLQPESERSDEIEFESWTGGVSANVVDSEEWLLLALVFTGS